jgi:hypothetical protein
MTSTSPNATTAGGDGKAVPFPRGEERAWFDGAREERLALTRCRACGAWSTPRVVCPKCWSQDVEVATASGKGEIYSYTVLYRAGRPGFGADVPYVVALVALDEGPRVMTTVVGVEPEQVRIGTRVRAVFERRGDIAFPVFTPETA